MDGLLTLLAGRRSHLTVTSPKIPGSWPCPSTTASRTPLRQSSSAVPGPLH